MASVEDLCQLGVRPVFDRQLYYNFAVTAFAGTSAS